MDNHHGCVTRSLKITHYLALNVLNQTDFQPAQELAQWITGYDLKGKRIFEIGEKYYFENPGSGTSCLASVLGTTNY